MAIIIIIIPNASRKERKRLSQGPDPDAAAAALPLPRSRVPGPSKGVEPRAAYIIYIYIYMALKQWFSCLWRSPEKRPDVAVQDLAAWRRQDAYRGPQTSTSWVDPSGVRCMDQSVYGHPRGEGAHAQLQPAGIT